MDEIVLKLLVIIGACAVTYYVFKWMIELLSILAKEGEHHEVD